MSGDIVGIVVCAALLVGVVLAGVAAYHRALPGGTYEGPMTGAVGRGALLGLFLGAAGFLFTLIILFIVRAAKG